MTIIYCKFLVFIISSSCLLYDSIPKKKHIFVPSANMSSPLIALLPIWMRQHFI